MPSTNSAATISMGSGAYCALQVRFLVADDEPDGEGEIERERHDLIAVR